MCEAAYASPPVTYEPYSILVARLQCQVHACVVCVLGDSRALLPIEQEASSLKEFGRSLPFRFDVYIDIQQLFNRVPGSGGLVE